MFRNYPLTTLFVIATICVDLALLFTDGKHSVATAASLVQFYLWNYNLPAQFSALALWAIFGKTFRLTKAAWVTLAGGALLLLSFATLQQPHINESVAISLIQVLAVMAGAAFFWLMGVGQVKADSEHAFRFSLVEIFGWTIIVAVWAFALRSLTAGFPIDRYFYIWMAALAITPILMVPVLFSKISVISRIVGVIGVYAAAFVAHGIGYQYIDDNPIIMWALEMAIAQITYISAWWAVVRMDEVMQERRAVIAASEEKLALYDPHES